MTDWTSGYVADIGYTFGYYSELNPIRTKLAFLNAGLSSPDVATACELGFGQGVSVNIHSAASGITWHGTDFNPSQASFAQELASHSGSPCFLSDQAFADFCAKDDLPDFDYIGLHGIWSWISDDNRKQIVEFIRRKLKVGGVLYISYNTFPGWAQMSPMRHLLTEHAEVMAAPGRGIVSRIDAALDFTDKLFALNPIFSRANPPVIDRLKQMQGQNRHYLAHEYFNRDWEPMHFADMVNWLEPAKVSYACSANLLDSVSAFNLTPEQASFLQEISDPNFRETVRDFMVNQQFRRDYWVKGARRLNQIEQIEEINKLRVVLVTPVDEISFTAKGPLGDATMNEDIYRPMLAELANHKPAEMKHLFEVSKKKRINTAQVLQGIMILIGRGDVSLAQHPEVTSRAQLFTSKLNRELIEKARGSSDVNYLASPVTGGGIPVGRSEQLFLLSIANGKNTPEEWSKDVWNTLSSLGQRIMKEGKPLEKPEDNLAMLRSQAEVFAAKKLPILKNLLIF